MPAYHSAYNEDQDARLVASMSLLPFRSRIRGPAPQPVDPSVFDIIDESIDLFRANSLFRNFEIKGPADRTLIYLILFISDCLQKIASSKVGMTQIEANKQLATLAVDNFALPGDAGFPLNALYQAPRDRSEADQLRQYLTHARQELVIRLIEKVYIDGKPSKWWLAFTKRRFMGKSLS
ncbi:putative ARC18-subunit of the Arp2/3 complex [Microstroma glucosiphilum]|uniref:Actin-related protein 2/3 complex subunit 3 n=1 Tax=Pseudomicrostroma glucosiphilum TaxID=1684307 RepID=A0A316UCT6_9BASI|nr:putative ARC18-subunit of the Arp2/3 complex [Pseudomicrostroma glucosiphilum]PWN23009.1 putative ARC18-subunit of the Arp2/3 complex [Pseudomicrostroma glucosiphilum]